MNERIFQEIDKRLPYSESDEYLDGLVERATEEALMHRAAGPVKRHWALIASAAAAALLVISIGVRLLNNETQPAAVPLHSSGPIDEFLNTLTDEEVAMLPYYEIEEIPEY